VRHVLHLLRDPANLTALEVIRLQAREPGLRLSTVLMQEALGLREPLPGEVYHLVLDRPGAPPGPGARSIGPSELLDLIFAADSVVTW
jgi:hypothetical protein